MNTKAVIPGRSRKLGFCFALAVARLTGNRADVDPLVRLAMNAILDATIKKTPRRTEAPIASGLTPRERSLPDLSPKDGAARHLRRDAHVPDPICRRGRSPDRQQKEVGIQVPDIRRLSSPPRASRGLLERRGHAFLGKHRSRDSLSDRGAHRQPCRPIGTRDGVRSPPPSRQRLRIPLADEVPCFALPACSSSVPAKGLKVRFRANSDDYQTEHRRPDSTYCVL